MTKEKSVNVIHNGDPTNGTLLLVDVGRATDVSEVHVTFIFRIEELVYVYTHEH